MANDTITRHDFPADFVFGAATAAYQVEGAYSEDGRGMSNWDAFSLRRPGKITGGSNGCVAINQYNRFKDDVLLMEKIGIDAYRLSISWSRILPGGRLSAGINKEGVKYYNDLIDMLLSQGIEPYVTIFHFDTPLCLEDEYGGFLSERIVPDFVEFAEVCFFEFGDRVKHWITINESWSYTANGYVTGSFPPAHGSSSLDPINQFAAPKYRSPSAVVDKTIVTGRESTEPYIVAHNLILAHAAAVDIYRKYFQAVQGGKIGVTNMTTWFEPYTDSEEDIAAASRALEFMWGWFVAPIVTGDYPAIMRELVGDRLLLGSHKPPNNPTPPDTKPNYYTDQQVAFYTERNGVPIGKQAGSDWLFIVPVGIYKLLTYTKDKYNNPLIYITENGVDEVNNTSLPTSLARKDQYRIECIQDHLSYVKQAIEYGVNVKTYFLWSMFDNYEWAQGYSVRFGIFYIDYANGLTRYPKNSAIWYMNFLNKNSKIQDEENAKSDPTKRKISA